MNRFSLNILIAAIILFLLVILFQLGIVLGLFLRYNGQNDIFLLILIPIPLHFVLLYQLFRKYKQFKNQLELKKGFSTPVSADGKVIPDNSHELERMFESAYNKPKPQQLIILRIILIFDIVLIAGAFIVGYIVPDFLEVIYLPVISLFIIVFISTFILYVKLRRKILDHKEYITNNKIGEVQRR